MQKKIAGRYTALSIGLHWLTLALLVAVYALMELRDVFPKGSAPREAMKTWHFMMGLTVFGLVFLRVALRWLFRAPEIHPAPPAWQRLSATVTHLALYAFLVTMPLLGWLTLSAGGKSIPFFGLQLPALVAPDKALAHGFKETHEAIATVGYYLIGLHAAAALFHHYVLRDDTVLRILPWRRRSPPRSGDGACARPHGGLGRNRTGVRGFAVRCMTTLPPGRWTSILTAGRVARRRRKNKTPAAPGFR